MAKRKKHKVPKTGPVLKLSGLEVTRLQKPQYNGYACGTGVHGDVKYNRAKAKQEWRRSSQGELPFYVPEKEARLDIAASLGNENLPA